MREAAADRAAVADLIMRDVVDRGPEQRMRGRKPRVVVDVAPAHQRAERAPVALILIPRGRQLRMSTSSEGWAIAERQHRHQGLAAGERLGVAVMGRQQRDGLIYASPGRRIRKGEVS